MFTPGRIQFIIFFVTIFTAGLVWAYRKDIQSNKYLFKGAWKVIVGFLLSGAALQLIVKLLF